MRRGDAVQGCSSCHGRTGSQKRSIGCMSGILRLLSRHHRHSHKRLSPSPAPPKKENSLNSPKKHVKLPTTDSTKFTDPYNRRSSCDMPRSPTIPLELRRFSNGSLDSPRGSSVIVARLMGLDVASAPQTAAPESAAEKRRRLMGALEKCDEDLKTLRKIIEAVRLAEIRMKGSETIGSGEEKRMDGGELIRKEMEQPSPNSVLDANAIYSPRFRHKRVETNENKSGCVEADSRVVKPSRMGVNFGDQQKKAKNNIEKERLQSHHPSVNEGLPKTTDILRNWQMRRIKYQTTADSVEVIWKERGFEERDEIERIEAMLESRIFGDLVEDMVLELFQCSNKLSFTLRGSTCRKRLHF
ncbi:hypothetical protein LUZ60_013235 [Juncus effusus]|nr:hypothetical protein LUZ60_013235 [Juncus effusus]